MSDLNELELRSALERRENVIRILENDLRAAERKRKKLHTLLTAVCKEYCCSRCGILPVCGHCEYHKTLEECK